MPATTAPVQRHTLAEDVAGTATGALLASLGLHLLDAGGAVTGGTAGLGLLVGHALTWPFAAVYATVSVPFVLLAGVRRGWGFAARTVAAVALTAAFSLVHPHALGLTAVDPVYAAVVGNLALGIGMLVLFRHGASLGGFTVVALLCQERRGWRAGHVQLALDAVVVALSTLAVPLPVALLSAAGVVVLNGVLTMNHRPGRYRAA